MFSHGDHAKIVKRPSCDATRASAVALILHELRGREMAGAAELGGMHGFRRAALDRLGHDQLLHPRPALAPADLGAERQQLAAIADHRRAVDRGQPGDGLDRAVDRLVPVVERAVGRPAGRD